MQDTEFLDILANVGTLTDIDTELLLTVLALSSNSLELLTKACSSISETLRPS